MSYRNKTSEPELWAILDADKQVMWSRGGSSSSPKLMVYVSEKKAIAALNNSWTKQIIDSKDVTVEMIYSV